MSFYSQFSAPWGELYLQGDERGLARLYLKPPSSFCLAECKYKPSAFKDVKDQLKAYFKCELKQFDLRLQLEGTPFQLKVWQALQAIPFGRVVSYSDIARVIQNPRAQRAVGSANGANPIPIIIPCHRVIANDGGLGGFSSGLHIKQQLLDHEGA